jgi:membrane-bound lytic murein transglycosylase D
MNRRFFLWLSVCAPAAVVAQVELLSPEELLDAGQQFLRNNVDPQVLAALPQLDRERVGQFLGQMQSQLHGDYVVDVASLRTSARTVLPLLEANPSTRSYASWLRTRMDYFEVADQYRLTIPAPKVRSGQPPKPAPNPSAQAQRTTWDKQVAKRPAPKGAAPLLPRLKQIFTQQGVPPELVWIAEVESSFDASARSPAGAVGLFQLMPKTAEGLGLKLSPRDERLDADKNGQAAARYLRSLYPRFNEWRLVLAAYNWGQGNVRRLMERQRAKTFDAIAVHLPAETQMYVPKIEAVLKRREKAVLAKLRAPSK